MQELLNYHLPESLIAKYPKHEPTSAKMLAITRGSSEIEHKHISDLTNILKPGDCLVINDTKVIPAQMNGHKKTGAKVHCQIDKIIDDYNAIVFLKTNKAPKTGDIIYFEKNINLQVIEQNKSRFKVKFNIQISKVLDQIGLPPIPPYLKRAVETIDYTRYQTCFAKNPGAVAAPTAGLHFTKDLLNKLKNHGIIIVNLTLHVGAGTFEPVTEAQIKSGKLHQEDVIVDQKLCSTLQKVKSQGNKVIAVGSTCLRALESAYKNNKVEPYNGPTDLLIQPGYKFQAVDGILTNFHLPGSSLLLLVAAFNSTDKTLAAYNTAIENNYRFFSYGDCMLIL